MDEDWENPCDDPPARASAPACQVVHAAVPGRLRVSIRGLKRQARLAAKLESRLAADPYALQATASARTGRVLIHHRVDCTTADVLDRVSALWDDLHAPAPSSPRTAASPPPTHHPSPWASEAAGMVSALASDGDHGLSGTEALARLAYYGPNRSATVEHSGWLGALVDQLINVPVGLLAASAGLSAATGSRLDAAAIAGVVAINTGIGLFTERQTERAIAALQQNANPRCRVRRGGNEMLLLAEDLVPGDVLLLDRGTFIAADARLIATTELTVSEAALTGESAAIRKASSTILPADTPLADRRNMVFAGTAVLGGTGRAVVTATGDHTELGRIQGLVASSEAPDTPLQIELDTLGRHLALLFAGLCGLIFLVGIARGQPVLSMLKLAASIAVAAVPEGLPTVATTTLALGVTKMRREGILVRQLAAVEALGEVETICFDKTGTLTENRMAVASIDTGEGMRPVDPARAGHRELLETAILATELPISGAVGPEMEDASATERALFEAASELGVDVAKLFQECSRISLQARTEQRPYVVSLHDRYGGEPLVAVKGSPDAVIAICVDSAAADGRRSLTDEDRDAIRRHNRRMAEQGLRVLGVAVGDRSDAAETGRLTWHGLVGLADPIRPGMAETLAIFRQAGARTVMITGDQSGTAYAIASALSLTGGQPLRVLESGDLARTDAATMAALTSATDVFARVSPSEKLDIVRALQGSGEVVAMTGDGINDSPALKAADIGVAMGKDGTEAARAIADIVLETDDIGGLALAIAEGRAIYDNIQRSVDFLVATNLSEIGVSTVAGFAGLPPPLTPVQLLWLNLVSDVFPALGLAVEAPVEGILERPPRRRDRPLLSKASMIRRGREGLVMTAAATLAQLIGQARYGPTERSRSLTLTTLVIAQLLHAYSARAGDDRPIWRQSGPRNRTLDATVIGTFAVQAGLSFLPAARRVFGLARPSLFDVALSAGLGGAALLTNELIKERTYRPTGAR